MSTSTVSALEGATPARQKSLQSRNEEAEASLLLAEKRNRASKKQEDFDPAKKLAPDGREYADALYRKSKKCGKMSPAEVVLVDSFICLFRDWYPEKDFRFDSLIMLLSMAEIDPSATSSLDWMFEEIRDGKSLRRLDSKWAWRIARGKDEQGHACEVTSRDAPQGLVWTPVPLRRNYDGVCPAKVGGLDPSQDEALARYAEFKAFPWSEQVNAIKSLSFRLICVMKQ